MIDGYSIRPFIRHKATHEWRPMSLFRPPQRCFVKRVDSYSSSYQPRETTLKSKGGCARRNTDIKDSRWSCLYLINGPTEGFGMHPELTARSPPCEMIKYLRISRNPSVDWEILIFTIFDRIHHMSLFPPPQADSLETSLLEPFECLK